MAADTAGAKPLTKARAEKLREACSHIYQYPAGKMVRELVSQGLLAPYRSAGYYQTTPKGREAVVQYEVANRILPPKKDVIKHE